MDYIQEAQGEIRRIQRLVYVIIGLLLTAMVVYFIFPVSVGNYAFLYLFAMLVMRLAGDDVISRRKKLNTKIKLGNGSNKEEYF